MNIFAFISLISAWFAFFLGSFVLYRNHKSRLNHIFFLYCLMLTSYAFIEFGMRQATSLDEALLWIRFNVPIIFVSPFLINFIIVFTEKTKWLKNKLSYLLIYGPALIFSLLTLLGMMDSGAVKEYWGWTFGSEKTIGFILFTIWGASLAFFALYLSVQYYLKTTGEKKGLAQYVLLGNLTFIGIAMVTELLTPFLNIKVPGFTGLGFLLGGVFFTYAIWKYSLFTLTPTTAADNIIATMSDSLFLADVDGKILKINPSLINLLGYKEEELIGNSMNILFTEGQFGNELLKKLLKSESFGSNETKYKTKSGRVVDISFSGSIVKDEKEQVTGIVGIAYDITERKKREIQLKERTSELNEKVTESKQSEIATLNILEDLQKTLNELQNSKEMIEQQNIQLIKLDQLKSSFLNVTSHELRTPMSAIKGYVQMTIKQTLGEITEEQKKVLTIVLRNVDRLDHLIQDILDISRLESGTMKFIPNKTVIKTLVEETVETMQIPADLKHMTIDVEVEDKMPDLTIDQERVKQVMLNIINNAIKFSPDGSIINIRAKKEEENILFEVQDSGRGIPKDKQEKIFGIFYQVDSGIDRKFGGAGLGLAISRGIVLAHGGKIWVDSDVGKGSTFYFALPIKSVVDMEEKFKGADIFGLEIKKEEKQAVQNIQ